MITVFGAGSIGCFVGGTLALAGHKVTLVGRPGLAEQLAQGFYVAAQGRALQQVPPENFEVMTSLAEAPPSEIVLVCVKSSDTAEAAATIATDGSKGATVISLQNGITNTDVLARQLGSQRVVAGMVGFNVVQTSPGAYSQTTEGEIILGQHGAGLVSMMRQTAITAQVHPNMAGVQWSKLLMNLNNGINTLSGLGLKAQLSDEGWRMVLARCISEGIKVARAEGVTLEKVGKVPPGLIPYVLRLPNFLFTRVAGAMLAIDPAARSSMAEDYERSRPGEIDWLNGYVMERAEAHGFSAPINTRVTILIKEAFADPKRPKLTLTASDILS